MSSVDEGHDEDASAAQPQIGTEPLACVSCRSRKLKCDRTKPACARCTKVNSECVYPESRRKPTFKRRNVRELEERLAQVESLLKGVNDAAAVAAAAGGRGSSRASVGYQATVELEQEDGGLFPSVSTIRTISDDLSPDAQLPFGEPELNQTAPPPGVDANEWQMMGLGFSEAPPPWDVIEELTDCYFNNHHHMVPIVHPGRYRSAMYGGPYMQPPMCLQYIIWAMAAQHHEKYSAYSDIFYKRSRLYFERDEMKGDGEHFITIHHAQALSLLASYEAKRMFFTRAAMNTAKCVRLINMMGLEKLDSPDQISMSLTLQPPKSWVEKEERRRTFWGAFAIDAHASVSTGWPSLVNSTDIQTRLPCSEDAFLTGKEETAPFLEEVYDGAEYSSFASTLVSCNIFKSILTHVHHPKASDRPDDVFSGRFWERHREFDNMLLSLLMFLPPPLKLHGSQKDAAAIYINLNIHASVICLHHAAIEQVEKHKLPDTIRQASEMRMRSSANEIVAIAKMAAHMTHAFKSPLCSLSFYTATTVFVYQGKQDPVSGLSQIDRSNLELVLRLMEAIGRIHPITHAFLEQAWNDLDRNGLSHIVRVPGLSKYKRQFPNEELSSIPLLTRTSNVSQPGHVSILPGRLPLEKPIGHKREVSVGHAMAPGEGTGQSARFGKMSALLDGECFQSVLGACSRNIDNVQSITHKRKRMSASPAPDRLAGQSTPFFQPGPDLSFSLPDRTGSSSSSSPAYPSTGTDTQQSGSSHTSPSMMGLGNTAEENRIDLRQFQGRVAPPPQWDPATEPFFFGDVTDEMVNAALGQAGGGEPWNFLTADIKWHGQGGQGG